MHSDEASAYVLYSMYLLRARTSGVCRRSPLAAVLACEQGDERETSSDRVSKRAGTGARRGDGPVSRGHGSVMLKNVFWTRWPFTFHRIWLSWAMR
jgi:hypothetical protein